MPHLLPGEKLLTVKEFEISELKNEPSAVHELERLSRAYKRGLIGDFGPVVASQSLEGHEPPEELRRYEAVFGRDALRVALDLLNQYPKLTRTTLITLAELQGVTTDISREEEPGRIIHEWRDLTDPVAIEIARTDGWGWPYYGSVDEKRRLKQTCLGLVEHRREESAISRQYPVRSTISAH